MNWEHDKFIQGNVFISVPQPKVKPEWKQYN